MAHFVRLDSRNRVVRRVVVNNSDILVNGVESEAKGIELCESTVGGTRWLQTSYSGSIRGRFAGDGYTYVEALDEFIPPCIYESWKWDLHSKKWAPPIPYPTDGEMYTWDEPSLSWKKVGS
jgi:hypothetical protein